jgi:hypothetical protein
MSWDRHGIPSVLDAKVLSHNEYVDVLDASFLVLHEMRCLQIVDGCFWEIDRYIEGKLLNCPIDRCHTGMHGVKHI